MHFSLTLITEQKPSEDDISRIMDKYAEWYLEEGEFEPICEEALQRYKEEYESKLEKVNGIDVLLSLRMPFEEYMLDRVGYEKNEETGEYGVYYNPMAEYDSYRIGGRWGGLLKTREDADTISDENLFQNDFYKCTEEGFKLCDGAYLKDLVLPSEDSAREMWLDKENQPCLQKVYGTIEKYINHITNYPPLTHAFVNLAGEIDIDDYHNREPWWISVFQKEIDKAGGDAFITIFDCHV